MMRGFPELAEVVALLPDLESIAQSHDPDDGMPVPDRALHKFLRPLVKTALVQALSETVKRVVRLERCPTRSPADMGFRCVSGRFGSTLARRMRKLGSGYFGQVMALDEHRAIKMQRFELFDAEAVQRLRDEIEIQGMAARLGVAAKVLDTFHCVCQDSGMHAAFIVQERLPGTTVDDAVLSPKDRDVVSAKLEALIEKLHANKIFHNDLHDSNVMVHKTLDAKGIPKWNVKILDFGLATRTTDVNPWRRLRRHAQNPEGQPARHTDFRIVEELRNPNVRSPSQKQQPKAVLKALTHRVLEALLKAKVVRVAP
jgi:tRNA A-37 threonylcarbamoyl transferase component Bud32